MTKLYHFTSFDAACPHFRRISRKEQGGHLFPSVGFPEIGNEINDYHVVLERRFIWRLSVLGIKTVV